jgi:hypothetical protein
MASSSRSPGPRDGTSAADKQQQQQQQPLSFPSRPQYIGLIDVESADGGKSILSECCLIVCRVRPDVPAQWKSFVDATGGPVHNASFAEAHQPLEVVEVLHRLVAPPPFQQVDMGEVRHVAQFITGLHWETLQRNGIPYLLLVRLLNDCLRKYPGIQLRARDEKLENQLLRRSDVTEVCQLLPEPLAQSFMQHRANRPLQLKAFCGETFTCPAHGCLCDQHLSRHPHCAYADCMEMLAWLQLWGTFDGSAAAPTATDELTASVSQVDHRMLPFVEPVAALPPLLFDQQQPHLMLPSAMPPFGFSMQQQHPPPMQSGDVWPALSDHHQSPMSPYATQSPAYAFSSSSSPTPPAMMTPFLCHPSYVYASMVAAATAAASTAFNPLAGQAPPPPPPLVQPLLWPTPASSATTSAQPAYMHPPPPPPMPASNALNVWNVAPPALRQ